MPSASSKPADPVFCVYEDRPDCEVGVRLMLASLRRRYPLARVVVFAPALSPGLRDWIGARPGITWREFNAAQTHGWDCKPDCLLRLLESGEREAVWLDSDLIVTGDLLAWLRRQPAEALVVAEDPCHLPQRGTGSRTRAWDLAPGIERGCTVNSCVLRVTPAHAPLLRMWRELLARPDYRRAQQVHILQRPFHLASDQDALGALLGSADFAAGEIAVLRSGADVVHSGGFRMDVLRDRIARLGRPRVLCVHAIAVKPWQMLPGVPEQRNFRWRLLRLSQELSDYTTEARRLRSEIGMPCPWLDHRTVAGCMLSALAFGSAAVRGLLFAVAVAMAGALGLGRRREAGETAAA
jgi:hypothetical protein